MNYKIFGAAKCYITITIILIDTFPANSIDMYNYCVVCFYGKYMGFGTFVYPACNVLVNHCHEPCHA